MNDKKKARDSLAELRDEDSLEILPNDSLASLSEQEIPIEISVSPTPQGNNFIFYLLAIFLLFTILVQYIGFNLENLVQNPLWRPYTSTYCSIVPCPEFATQAPGLYSIDNIVVRTHPQKSNALQVDLIFSHDANQPLSLPLASLLFTDNNGRLLASRDFLPEEYLPEEISDMSVLPPGTRVQTILELVDPGTGASNYTIEFK